MDSIRELLKECKLEAVAHRRTELLRKTSMSTSAAQSLAILKEGNILSIPVVDEMEQFCGVFSVSDFLRAMVKEIGLDHAFDKLSAEEVAGKLKALYARPVSKIMHNGELWYVQGQDPTVMDAVKDMLLRGQVHHRLFTCDTLKDTSPTGILSQSDIVRLMWDHKVELGPLLAQSVEQLGLCAAAAECMDASTPLANVLAALFRDHKSCMGITHDNSLVGNLSISDLRSFTPEHAAFLMQPVGNYLLACRGLPVPEGDAVNWTVALRGVPLYIVTPSTPFQQVLQVLAVNHLHRVYVLDDTEHAIGIITLTDVLRQLLPNESAEPMEGPAGGLPHSSELPDSIDVEVSPVAQVVAH